MRMRIRPGKMDPDTRVKTFFQDLLKLPYKAEMTILFSFLFSLISVLKLKPLRDREILLSPFLNSSDLGHENKTCFFFLQFAPWIQIRGSAYFSGSGSRKRKSCGFNGSGSSDIWALPTRKSKRKNKMAYIYSSKVLVLWAHCKIINQT